MASSRPQRTAKVAAINRLHDRTPPQSENSDQDESSSSSSDDDNDNIDIIIAHESSSDESETTTSEGEHISGLEDKNGHDWSLELPSIRRRRAADIIRHRAGPKPIARKDTILETWMLFFPDSMLEKILHYSQLKAHELDIDVNLNSDQLKAFIAILYYRGASHDQSIPVDHLWEEHSSDFYRAAMSKHLFKIWCRVIRFDDSSTRSESYEHDAYTAFPEIWDDFNDRLNLFFEASDSVVVDEQLMSSRCRSPHKTYNPSKPGKYGEMMRWCADGKHRYFFRGSPMVRAPQDIEAAAIHKESKSQQSCFIPCSALSWYRKECNGRSILKQLRFDLPIAERQTDLRWNIE